MEDVNRDLWSPNECSSANKLLAKQSQDYLTKINLEPFAKLICFFKAEPGLSNESFFVAIYQACPFFKLKHKYPQ